MPAWLSRMFSRSLRVTHVHRNMTPAEAKAFDAAFAALDTAFDALNQAFKQVGKK